VKQQQQQQSSSKYSTYFDTFYNTTRSLNNASSFFSSSHSNAFIPYQRPSARSTGMKPSSSSSAPAPQQDLLSQMITEFSLEYARELARKAASSAATTTIASTPQPNMQSSPIQGSLLYNPILDVHKQQQEEEEDVFGYRFEICKDCLYTEPLKVSFGKGGTKDNSNNSTNNSNNNNGAVDGVVPRKEQKHVCNPKVVASNRKEVQDIEGSVKTMVDNLPKIASRMTKWSINSQNKRISLIAVRIPHKIKNNDHEDNYNNIAGNTSADDNNDDDDDNDIQPQQDIIVIPNPKNPKQQITFQCSEEKHINLSLISNETSKNHYAARAIKYGHPILTNEEMEDFLNMVQTSTFAIFKIHKPSPTTATASSLQHLQQQQQHHHHHKQQDEPIGLYFLAIIPYDDILLYLQSWLPNEINDSNDSNNNKSIQSNSANEDFLSLCNHLANISNFTIPMRSPSSSSV
ncbi:MAG TPA: hypothetical protein VE223_05290, partial [Nitrososphaeraceae archaeon]|nr:hypothetical protein [Nitrososphaeraceae archaeon]